MSSLFFHCCLTATEISIECELKGIWNCIINVKYQVKFFYFNPVCHVGNLMETLAINIQWHSWTNIEMDAQAVIGNGLFSKWLLCQNMVRALIHEIWILKYSCPIYMQSPHRWFQVFAKQVRKIKNNSLFIQCSQSMNS